MHAFRWPLFAFLAIGLSLLSASAQTKEDSKVQSFENCLNDSSECDQSQLNAEQRQEVANIARDHNLGNCLAGIGECDSTLLDPLIRKKVECVKPSELFGHFDRLRSAKTNCRGTADSDSRNP
jgi:hypothetical protein